MECWRWKRFLWREDEMLRKVLYIDLTREESWVEERQELFESWMGGTGVGIRLLQEECPPGRIPSRLRPDHPIHWPPQRPLPGGYEDRCHIQVAPYGELRRVLCRWQAQLGSALCRPRGSGHKRAGRSSLLHLHKRPGCQDQGCHIDLGRRCPDHRA